METVTPKKRSKGDINKALLKYPVSECDNCKHDFLGVVTPAIEFGKDTEGGDIVTGFCPICGRGYPMIEPKPEVPPEPEAEKVADTEETATFDPVIVDADLEGKEYPKLQQIAQKLGIKSNQKRDALIKAIREA